MGFAAAGYAKYHLRRRFMFPHRLPPGPAPPNLLTGGGTRPHQPPAELMLCGDTFLTACPTPVLQQVETFGNPALGLNDASSGLPLLGQDHASERR